MASGDINYTASKTVSGVTLIEINWNIENSYIVARFRETATGKIYEIIVRNGLCQGFDCATGAALIKTMANGYTNAKAALFVSGGEKSALQAAASAGLITGGTVQ